MAGISCTVTIHKFGQQGEKTGWTYVPIPSDLAARLFPGRKTSFRVSGTLDEIPVKAVAVLPMGEGDFILPLKADLRRKLRKGAGDTLNLSLRLEEKEPPLSSSMLECLADEPAAREIFDKLPGSHKRYYSNWVDSAKTTATQSRRIAAMIHGLLHGLTFAEMMKASSAK